jgi:hypothetical protein
VKVAAVLTIDASLDLSQFRDVGNEDAEGLCLNNIGNVYRTLNVPLQTLELMHPQYRKRFEFSVAGREKVLGQEAIVVAFREACRCLETTRRSCRRRTRP